MKNTVIQFCKKNFLIVFPIILVTLSIQQVNGWGFWAHKRINRLAVFTLPPEMIGFYKANLEFVTAHAVDPDKRRYSVEGEDKNHYIDVDYYGEYPFDMVPRQWNDAIEKYSEDTIREYGILPWNLEWTLKKLTRAFEDENINKILRHSSDIGHYLGDAHVPLHTTLNYNGQLTNQKGIHGFWESRCPELFADANYDYFVGKAEYIENPNEKFWEIVLESHSHVKHVLALEKQLTEEFPSDKKYAFDQRGQSNMRNYSIEFSEAYERKMNGMIEARMQDAILSIGSFWFTAWVNAGQPDLKKIGQLLESEDQIKKDDELENEFKSGKIKGRDHQN